MTTAYRLGGRQCHPEAGRRALGNGLKLGFQTVYVRSRGIMAMASISTSSSGRQMRASMQVLAG